MTVLVEEFKILISTFSHVSVVDDPLKESPELFIVQYDFGLIGFISDCIPIEVSVGPSNRVSNCFQRICQGEFDEGTLPVVIIVCESGASSSVMEIIESFWNES